MQVDGYSLDAQRDKLRKYAAYEDMVVAGEYSDEGFSGKNIQGRQEFQRMLNDIQDCKDGVSYVLVFKLSRFGRNAADVLNSLQLMQDFGVNLICVEDGIDSSKDAGKLMISVLSAVAEIERENIRTQTMAGREQKAREGKWNGGFAPYGYKLESGNLVIAEDEVEVIRVIYDRYIHTNEGVAGVAKYLNRNGFVKKLRQNNTIPGFSRNFVQDVLDNPVYMGKIAYGRRRTEKRQGTRNEMHVVEQSEFPVYDGQHEAIISEEDCGVHAKMVSGKPLCIHVHATDFDRSRGKVNPTVYSMEKNGMDYADCIMCVSELTRRTVIEQYHQNPKKVFAMHNAVYPLSQEYQDIPRPDHSKEKIVTFLGRITMQKGPEYFVEAASLVLQRARNIRFVMAGSGDMMDAMINLAAERGIADRFHFPGFMKGKQVYEVYKNSDVFVMPSVSEPFGIAPLEAMQCGTPSIISKQSGCGEILDKVIKTDYWDIHAMADAIYSLCTNPALFQYLQEEGRKEVDGITWEKVGLRIRALYEDVLRNYGK